MSYQQVFGGTTIYPSDVSYLALALNADKALEWPLESNDPSNPAARIIDVTTSGSYSVTLPDATQTGAGQTILFNNLPASTNSFLVKDHGGNTIATVGVGEQWQVYLSGTSTAAGTWRVFRYGASTATVQASALAGYGLTVTSNTLSQSLPVTTFNTSPRTLLATDRASALVWTGTGTGTLNLLSAATVGNNFFIAVRNSGGGDLTVDAAGSETIDDLPSLALRPGDSANLMTDGLTWYTLGLGQEAVFAFDYTSISVTGGTYTLTGSELNRIAYKFVGTLAADQYVVVPATVQQYWVDNATTGAYNFYLQTSGGTPVGVGQGTRGIYYCDGTNVVDADTATISLPVGVTDGGTGITSYTIGDLLYANSATTLAKLSDVAVGNVLRSGGVGAAPAWGKVVLTTDVSGTLPVANGGTGATSLTSGYLVKGNGTSAASASVVYDDGTNVGIGTTAPGAKLNVVDNSASDALRITQTGAGNALVVEDSANPDSTPFVIDASGRFIHGYTSALTLRGITWGNLFAGIDAATAGSALARYSANASSPIFEFFKSRNASVSGNTIVQSGDSLGTIIFSGADGTDFVQGASITAAVDGTPGSNDMPGRLVFSTTADGASSPTERMRITSAGDVGIGNTPSGTYKLEVTGAIYGSSMVLGAALPVASGGTGQTTYTNGQLLIGNTTGNTLTKATLTAGSGISVTNGAGSITIAATGSMVYPGAGIAVSTGSAWATSLTAPSGAIVGTTDSQTLTNKTVNGANNTITNVSLTTAVTGTLPVANGGTGQTTYTNGQLLIGNTTGNTLTKATLTAGSGISITNGNGSITIAATGGSGTVTSVALSGGTTGLTVSGSPITTSGTITLAGTLAVANGGTGATTLTGVVIGNGTSAFTVKTNPTGAFVGTTDTQTLTNKTISADNNTLSGIAASSFVLSNASGNIDGAAAQKAIPTGVVVGTTDTQTLTNKTFTTGNTLDAGTSISDTGTIAATSPGFRGLPQSSNTTLALTDAGKHIYTTSNVTIPANSGTAFPVGTTVVIANSGSSTLTISITTDTLRQAGTTNTGTRTLAAYGLATCVKVASTTWFITGNIT